MTENSNLKHSCSKIQKHYTKAILHYEILSLHEFLQEIKSVIVLAQRRKLP